MSRAVDLAVIGAGPAGLAAAIEARRIGLSVLLIDEQPGVGGQIYRATDTSPVSGSGILGAEYRRGGELALSFRASGARHMAGSTLVDITADGWIGFEGPDGVEFVEAAQIILASGAVERPFPVPGWTLPGVMTVGAAQTVLKASGAAPQDDAVLVGSGPLLYLYAVQLLRSGRRPQAIVDTAPRLPALRALRHFPRALAAPLYLAKGLRLLNEIRKSGTVHHRGATGIRIEGADAAESIVFQASGRRHSLNTSLVLLHQGVVPNIQITQALRCRHRWDDAQLCWVPETDEWAQTSRPGLRVAGDGAGIAGALAAEYRGRIAAIGAALALDRIVEPDAEERARPLRRLLKTELAARPLLDALYRPADDLRVPSEPDTIVCRCEEVTLGDISRAVTMGCPGPNQLKAFVRAGMGPCQGRMCALTVTETIASLRGRHPGEIGSYRLRPPFKPTTLGALAAMKLPDAPEIDRAGNTGTVELAEQS